MRTPHADNHYRHALRRLQERYFKPLRSVEHVHRSILSAVRNQDSRYTMPLISQANFVGKERNPHCTLWMVIYKKQALFPVFDESTQEIVTYLEPKHALRNMRRHLAEEGQK